MKDYKDKTSDKLLINVKQFARTDWGGKDPHDQIKKKLKSKGIECGDKSAAAIKELCEDQVAGVRSRQNSRIDEVIRRLRSDDDNNAPEIESLP